MLRGHQSLQQLIGKSSRTRRAPGTGNKGKRARLAPEDRTCHVLTDKLLNEGGSQESVLGSDGSQPHLPLPLPCAKVPQPSSGVSPQPDKPFVNGSTMDFECPVVGLRHHSRATCSDGCSAWLSRHPDNLKDRNAIQVTVDDIDNEGECCAFGHIPAQVASELAGIMDDGLVTISGIIRFQANGNGRRATMTLHAVARECIANDKAAKVHKMLRQAQTAASLLLSHPPPPASECLRSNFAFVLESVLLHDCHLLSANDLTFSQSFKLLSHPSQCLFLRLFLRKGPWFRVNSLRYAEVSDMAACIQELAQQDLVTLVDKGSGTAKTLCHSMEDSKIPSLIEELVGILTAPELQLMLASVGDGNIRSKSRCGRQQLAINAIEMLQSLESQAPVAVPSISHVVALTGPCLRLQDSARATVARLQRLFFLNESQDLSSFLAVEYGAIKWPHYNVNVAHSAFTTQEHLMQYEEAIGHAQVLDDALEIDDMDAAEAALEPVWRSIRNGDHKRVAWTSPHEALGEEPPAGTCPSRPPNEANLTAQCSVHANQPKPPLFLARFCSAWVHVGMATVGVSILEKRRQYRQAVEHLRSLLGGNCCPSRRGYWWNRLAVNLEHIGRHDEALECCETALADEWLRHGDKLGIQRRILRLGKPPRRWRRPAWAPIAMQEPREVQIWATPVTINVTMGKTRYIGLDGEYCNVEEFALQHYATEQGGGWRGCHSENGVWATIFSLVMWDVLFSDVPDVFRTPFQSAPLDLDTDAFYPSRRSAIEARLAVLRSGGGRELLASTWEDNFEVACQGINWRWHGLDELVEIVGCIGGPGLAEVCRLLAEDHKGWSGGMPDLLLWNPSTTRAKLAEVKGPRDRLSDQQRAWIAALTAAGMEVEVCKVLDATSSSTPKKRRQKGA
ncbi:unnamed protein product [Ostreobium quekettii]|uniref:Fanconi-associated nuclease n=1 Tax=Ostreobium quekettii TaxID=121088 RepID=A0A8S1ISR1_9CHLO|nr:unnamed protein product [Ostreobium quekettii]